MAGTFITFQWLSFLFWTFSVLVEFICSHFQARLKPLIGRINGCWASRIFWVVFSAGLTNLLRYLLSNGQLWLKCLAIFQLQNYVCNKYHNQSTHWKHQIWRRMTRQKVVSLWRWLMNWNKQNYTSIIDCVSVRSIFVSLLNTKSSIFWRELTLVEILPLVFIRWSKIDLTLKK